MYRAAQALCLALALAGCDGTTVARPAGPGLPTAPATAAPSVPDRADPPAIEAEKARVAALVAEAQQTDTEALLARHAVPFADDLGYDPLDARNLEAIQASPFALDDDELAALQTHGFVITDRQRLGHFVAGYERIYNADLPVYITADSLLHALHRSFETLLKTLEGRALLPTIDQWLGHLHARVGAGAADAWGPQVAADLDVYLAVALTLLRDAPQAPVAGADPAQIAALAASARAAGGLSEVVLFGQRRVLDWSQFLPRGHYTDSESLTRYFRAMMWLGRIDLRLIYTDELGQRVVDPRAVATTLALREVLDAPARTTWAQIEAVLRSLIGPQDFMTVDRLDDLHAALDGAADATALAAFDEPELFARVMAGGFDVQRIAGGYHAAGAGLPVSFTLLGQRYIVDSEVLTNVVWDRVRAGRMLPDPLDAAFAVFGNDHAAALLAPQLETFEYAGHLAAMRALMDDRSPAAWQGDLYGQWLGALRTLSPDPAVVADPAAAGRPSVTGTEAWGRRLLNTQLGSWAELRHDTVLYAKPSYTSGGGCDYPDGYVEPVPAFYQALADLADHGRGIAEGPLAALAPELAEALVPWWTTVHEVSTTLHGLARQQETGEPFSPEQVQWLEQAVDVAPDDYEGYVVGGWYGALFLEADPYRDDLIVADLHTQPTDLMNVPVGRVLHLGTGPVRLMVTTVAACDGPRAYAGPVYAVHSVITEGFERLTDETWRARWRAGVDELPWLDALIVR